MRHLMFYILLIIQAVILVGLAWQYYLVDSYGETVKLTVDRPISGYIEYEDMTYIYFDINKISKDQWDIDEELTYNDIVFVLLASDDEGIAHVKKASKQKMPAGSNEFVLKAHYKYDYSGTYHVKYGIEKILDHSLYNSVELSKRIIATLKIAPWGQRKVIQFDNQ